MKNRSVHFSCTFHMISFNLEMWSQLLGIVESRIVYLALGFACLWHCFASTNPSLQASKKLGIGSLFDDKPARLFSDKPVRPLAVGNDSFTQQQHHLMLPGIFPFRPLRGWRRGPGTCSFRILNFVLKGNVFVLLVVVSLFSSMWIIVLWWFW